MQTIIISVLVLAGIVSLIIAFLASRSSKRKIRKQKLLAQNEEEKQRQNNVIRYFIKQLEQAQTLTDIFILHIQLWANGIHNPNFGPNEYGMFRTRDILLMKKEEVFLGNIWGLFTKPLPYWENCPDERPLIIEQYKNQLLSNLKEMLK